jgi:hypothetical protein
VSILKTPLDASLLLQLIEVMDLGYLANNIDPLPFLRKVALVPRFDTILMFLEPAVFSLFIPVHYIDPTMKEMLQLKAFFSKLQSSALFAAQPCAEVAKLFKC